MVLYYPAALNTSVLFIKYSIQSRQNMLGINHTQLLIPQIQMYLIFFLHKVVNVFYSANSKWRQPRWLLCGP